MNDKEVTEFCRRNWYTLDVDYRRLVVAMLQNKLDIESYQKAMADDPHGWSVKGGWYMFGGMGIRNLLREQGFIDSDLKPVEYPDGGTYQNWDDYYTAALEAAAGVIEV